MQFLAVLVTCIAGVTSYFVLVVPKEPVRGPFMSVKGTLAEGPNLDLGAISEQDSLHLSTSLREPLVSAEQQDIGNPREEHVAKEDLSASLLKGGENSASPNGNVDLAVLPSFNPIGELPEPHSQGWKTVVSVDAPNSPPEGDAKGAAQLGSSRVVTAVKPESSPGLTNRGSAVHPLAEASRHEGVEDLAAVFGSDPYQLLPPGLKKSGSTMQGKSENNSSSENELALRSQQSTRGDLEPTLPQSSSILVGGAKSELAGPSQKLRSPAALVTSLGNSIAKGVAAAMRREPRAYIKRESRPEPLQSSGIQVPDLTSTQRIAIEPGQIQPPNPSQNEKPAASTQPPDSPLRSAWP
jgi:hypothetical protein